MRVHSLHIQPIKVYICCLRLSVHYRLQQPASMYMCERPVGHSPSFRDDHVCVPVLPDPICMFLDTGHYFGSTMDLKPSPLHVNFFDPSLTRMFCKRGQPQTDRTATGCNSPGRATGCDSPVTCIHAYAFMHFMMLAIAARD